MSSESGSSKDGIVSGVGWMSGASPASTGGVGLGSLRATSAPAPQPATSRRTSSAKHATATLRNRSRGVFCIESRTFMAPIPSSLAREAIAGILLPPNTWDDRQGPGVSRLRNSFPVLGMEQRVRDDDSLNLRRPLVKLRNLGVAIIPLHGEFLGVAVT